MYVVDSIVKNLEPTIGNYRKLFEKKIVDMVAHVFKEVIELVLFYFYTFNSLHLKYHKGKNYFTLGTTLVNCCSVNLKVFVYEKSIKQ